MYGKVNQLNVLTHPPFSGFPSQLGHPVRTLDRVPCAVLWVLTVVVHLLSHVRLCNPMNCTTPGFPVLHCLLELLKLMPTELVMPSNRLSSPSPPAFNLSQHQGLFQ
ncbi:unnamed protein product [Rangifer tarandus platyrhynchus]|uniref:Uncharacterized protein n=1 Tax=Rangifer tarandus platyrhynchus TaxID=3082113 RepID=A0AC60A4W5_RANTA